MKRPLILLAIFLGLYCGRYQVSKALSQWGQFYKKHFDYDWIWAARPDGKIFKGF